MIAHGMRNRPRAHHTAPPRPPRARPPAPHRAATHPPATFTLPARFPPRRRASRRYNNAAVRAARTLRGEARQHVPAALVPPASPRPARALPLPPPPAHRAAPAAPPQLHPRRARDMLAPPRERQPASAAVLAMDRQAPPPELTSGLPASEHHSLYNAHMHQLQQLHAAPTAQYAAAADQFAQPNEYAPPPSNAYDAQRPTGDFLAQFPFPPADHSRQQARKALYPTQAAHPQQQQGTLFNPGQAYPPQQNIERTRPLQPQQPQQQQSQQQQQQPAQRSLLQHSYAPQLPHPDAAGRYAHHQVQAQAPTNTYMLHQAQHLGVPDDFSAAGQMRQHDPRAAGMVSFPTPVQQFMPRYTPVSQAAPSMENFAVGGASNQPDPHHQAAANSTLLDNRTTNDALYRPLMPGQKPVNIRTSSHLQSTAYAKSAPLVALQQGSNLTATNLAQMPNDPQNLLSPSQRAAGATELSNAVAKARSKAKQPTVKKDPQLVASTPVAANVASGNQGDGVPSTVVSDAVGGSAADNIDGSLIERLRGFSHVNQTQQPKQQLLLPQGATLPPNLFPGSVDGQTPTLNHDPYRVPTIRRQHVANRPVGDAGVMLPGQRGLPMAAPPQLALNMSGAGSPSAAAGGASAAAETSPERPFRCKYCQASFGRRDNMQKHERSIHMGERPFVCEICSYAFQKKDHKDKHVRTVHLKERPYKCSLCESRFGQKSDLTKHIRTVHQRIKPFRCEHCGLSFGHRGNKLRHVFVVHQKRKPHVCRICSQAFGERSNLAKHSLAVHKLALK